MWAVPPERPTVLISNFDYIRQIHIAVLCTSDIWTLLLPSPCACRVLTCEKGPTADDQGGLGTSDPGRLFVFFVFGAWCNHFIDGLRFT